jgi:hypothetical protein
MCEDVPPPTGDGVSRQDWVRAQAQAENLRLTLHAHAEMMEEGIRLDELLEALRAAEMLEDYPGHRRGPCCLVLGWTALRRPLHVVCASAGSVLIVITVYEPRPPKWVTPTERRYCHGHV